MDRKKLNWLFDYDRDKGILIWKNNPFHNKQWLIGLEAGSIHNKSKGGYRRIWVQGMRVLTHRLIYFLETNSWPKIIDHINGNTLDNRIENLREVNGNKNQGNRKQHRNGKLVGAQSRGPGKFGYEACVTLNKKRYRLGYFNTEIEAHQAYMCKAKELGVL